MDRFVECIILLNNIQHTHIQMKAYSTVQMQMTDMYTLMCLNIGNLKPLIFHLENGKLTGLGVPIPKHLYMGKPNFPFEVHRFPG